MPISMSIIKVVQTLPAEWKLAKNLIHHENILGNNTRAKFVYILIALKQSSKQ